MGTKRLYEALAGAFAAEGVDTLFTLLGDGNMHWATVLSERHGVKTIHARHENCACAMANAYARVTGKVGVASVTRGPGLSQIMTALTTAARGEIPLVIFAGETPAAAVWTNQQADQAPYVRACNAEYLQIRSVQQSYDRVREAFCIARGERRPVVLGVADDLQRSVIPDMPEYRPSASFLPPIRISEPGDEDVFRIADLIIAAKRPIIIAGRGVVLSGAREDVLELAARAGALLSTTLLARGLFENEDYSLGIAGGWSSDIAISLFSEADLVIAIGASLAGFTTNSGKLFPNARVIHIDAAPRAVRNGRALATVHMQCDARVGAAAINRRLAVLGELKNGFRSKQLLEEIKHAESSVDDYDLEPGTFHPREVVQEIDRVIPKDWFFVGGSGHCAYFTATGMRGRSSELYANIRDFGAIGSNLAHAIGVAVARNSSKVLLIDGDGSMLMHIEELETIARHRLKMLLVVLNDGAYGSEVHRLRAEGMSPRLAQFGRTDFASIARGFKLRGATVSDLSQIDELFRDHMMADTAEIWDIPISGNVLSPQFQREAQRAHRA